MAEDKRILKGKTSNPIFVSTKLFMRTILILASAVIFFASCSGGKSTPLFCDTTCLKDTLRFKGDAPWEQTLNIGFKNCDADTLSYSYRGASTEKRIHLPSYVGKSFKLNPSAMNYYFQDTTLVWLTFNDCTTGRGFLLKLSYSDQQMSQKITSALNSFDKKFTIDPDLRAYTDGGNIYVDNIKTGKQAQMTFKEEYIIDYEDIHKVVDSINVTKNRIFVQLMKDGQPKTFEKKIDL